MPQRFSHFLFFHLNYTTVLQSPPCESTGHTVSRRQLDQVPHICTCDCRGPSVPGNDERTPLCEYLLYSKLWALCAEALLRPSRTEAGRCGRNCVPRWRARIETCVTALLGLFHSTQMRMVTDGTRARLPWEFIIGPRLDPFPRSFALHLQPLQPSSSFPRLYTVARTV